VQREDGPVFGGTFEVTYQELDPITNRRGTGEEFTGGSGGGPLAVETNSRWTRSVGIVQE
jgi:hypothetical protein